jgi:hypothetical protein
MSLDRATLRSVIVAVGIAAAGFLVGNGFVRAKAADRYVTVKGVSEREVRADLAVWPLHLVGADNDLAIANAKLTKSTADVRAFLIRHGVDTSQIQVADFSASDALASQMSGDRKPTNRFVVHQTLLVRSNQPEKVMAASQQIGELAAIGVVISSGSSDYGSGGGPSFVFTDLAKLKPEMIAEATSRAREAATQFAKDSRSDVGSIRQASQGIIEILARDQAPGIEESSQIAKVVRVVVTIDYYLR